MSDTHGYRPEAFFEMPEPKKAFWLKRYEVHQEQQSNLMDRM